MLQSFGYVLFVTSCAAEGLLKSTTGGRATYMLGEGFGGLVIVPRIIVVRELLLLCWCSGGLTWRLGVGGVYICMYGLGGWEGLV